MLNSIKIIYRKLEIYSKPYSKMLSFFLHPAITITCNCQNLIFLPLIDYKKSNLATPSVSYVRNYSRKYKFFYPCLTMIIDF